MRRFFLLWVGLLICQMTTVFADDGFFSLKIEPESAGFNSWGIMDRAGGAQDVGPYLSSLKLGEAATGRIVGPAFTLDVDEVRFWLNGHDGPGGGANQNRIELCDSQTDEVLRQTLAPGQDTFLELSWNTADLNGRSVYIAVEDANPQTAFAWMGVQKIEAGEDGSIDFSLGVLPPEWKIVPPKEEKKPVPIQYMSRGAVPFVVFGEQGIETVVPDQKSVSVDCGGVTVRRVFLLGMTTNSNRLLLPGATVDLIYADGEEEHVPLMYGFTLAYMRQNSHDPFLWPADDQARSILAIEPQQKPLAQIGFTREKGTRPKVVAVTCQTADGNPVAETENVLPLKDVVPGEEYMNWVATRSVSSTNWKSQFDAAEVYREHGVPYDGESWRKLESRTRVSFRKVKIADAGFEAASIADINGDGKPDLISGDFWYEGPEFTRSHKYAEFSFDGNYYDDFSDLIMDVNGDGRLDVVTGGWTGGTLRWLENPGETESLWPVHEIDRP
ncbi:MAG: VCBS repeat-containing protein, partial [Thermoguttaceae bacterium]|nr:VCBS repeat-containing protein [Thermoguttaceae bacterium]